MTVLMPSVVPGVHMAVCYTCAQQQRSLAVGGKAQMQQTTKRSQAPVAAWHPLQMLVAIGCCKVSAQPCFMVMRWSTVLATAPARYAAVKVSVQPTLCCC